MEWLSQNWILLALGIGAVVLMSRGGRAGGGCCGIHGGDDPIKTGKTGKPDAHNAGVHHRHG